MLKLTVLIMVLLTRLLGGTAWANESLNTELTSAIRSDDMVKVEELIVRGADVNAMGSNGMRPLLVAVIRGKKDMAELLIAKGADVSAKGENGITPLHAAAIAFKAPKDVAELFIAKGADVNAKDSKGLTPLQAWELKSKPVWWVNKDVIDLLIANGAK